MALFSESIGSNPSLSAKKLLTDICKQLFLFNIPFFEFRSQADLCGYEWICTERNLSFSCCTGKSSIFTKYSNTQAFVFSKHLQNQLLPIGQVYWSTYWVITFNFHSPLLQAQEKTQGHSQQDYKAWQHGGATSLSYLCHFLYLPTHHLPPFLYETHSSHSHG